MLPVYSKCPKKPNHICIFKSCPESHVTIHNLLWIPASGTWYWKWSVKIRTMDMICCHLHQYRRCIFYKSRKRERFGPDLAQNFRCIYFLAKGITTGTEQAEGAAACLPFHISSWKTLNRHPIFSLPSTFELFQVLGHGLIDSNTQISP